MQAAKMMVFRVLKWLALVWAILLVIVSYVSAAESTDEIALFTAATPLVLFAIFFHLEQHKS